MTRTNLSCKICNKELIGFNFAKTPISGYVLENLKESLSAPKFDLNFLYCEDCNFGQYINDYNTQQIFEMVYAQQQSTYGMSKDLDAYLDNFARKIIEQNDVDHNFTVCEIGCNNGILLKKLRDLSKCKVFGIEPSNQFLDDWEANNLFIINDYLSIDLLQDIPAQPDIIIIRHVLEHIDDLNSFIVAIKGMLKKDSVVVIESPDIEQVILRDRFDNLGHQHVNYFSKYALRKLLFKHGLNLQNFEDVETDGGSLMMTFKNNFRSIDLEINNFISKNDIFSFFERFNQFKNSFKKLSFLKAKDIIGYGGGPKGQHLIHLFGLNRYLNVVLNDLNFYHTKFIPGTSIKYSKDTGFYWNNDLVVINLAPTHYKAIRNKIPEEIFLYDFFRN